MKIYCFFTEPASYTLDLIEYVYNPLKIDFCFLKSESEAKTNINVSENIFLDRISFFKYLKLIIRVLNNYDIVIFNSYNNHAFILTMLLKLFGFKKVKIAIESDTQLIIPENITKRLLKRIYLSYVFKKKYVYGLAAGNYTHKDLFRFYGMTEKNIFLMPLMVNNFKFYPKNVINKKEFIFLFVGRLIKRKNIESLINIFNYKFQDKKAILKIIGDGPLYDYLINKYSSDKVKIIGKLFDDELVKEFNKSSVLVCPSYFEPWGLVVNEALSSSLPVIARREVGSVWDLLDNKKTGFIVKNDKQMGEKMLEFFNNKDLLDTYSKNAYDLMKNYWNYDLYINCLNKFIGKIRDGNRSGN